MREVKPIDGWKYKQQTLSGQKKRQCFSWLSMGGPKKAWNEACKHAGWEEMMEPEPSDA